MPTEKEKRAEWGEGTGEFTTGMRSQSRRSTKTAINCGRDSPALLNHNASCWSLHACIPSPLRQSCKTAIRAHGQKSSLTVIPHKLQSSYRSDTCSIWVLTPVCLFLNSTSLSIVLIYVHVFDIRAPTSLFRFGSLVWSPSLPVAWWLASNGGQPSPDWDNAPDWIKAPVIDEDWLREPNTGPILKRTHGILQRLSHWH